MSSLCSLENTGSLSTWCVCYKKNAMETNAELRYGHPMITILLRSNISGCYTTLFYAEGKGGKIRCVTSRRVT